MIKYLKSFFAVFIGVRKFVLALLFITLGLGLMLFNFITGNEFIMTTRDVVVAFIGANIGEHVIETIKDWIKVNKKK